MKFIISLHCLIKITLPIQFFVAFSLPLNIYNYKIVNHPAKFSFSLFKMIRRINIQHNTIALPVSIFQAIIDIEYSSTLRFIRFFSSYGIDMKHVLLRNDIIAAFHNNMHVLIGY